jgi:nitrogen regulatory protein PII
LRKAQEECGATGGTIFLGEGTVQSKLLEKLGLTEVHKEILMISADGGICDKLYEMFNRSLILSKRINGIAFSIPFKRRQLQDLGQKQKTQPKKVKFPYFCIMTIVDKGRGKECMKAARAAGAKGGTLIHGRGAGIPTDFYFPLVIEPQKDIVMIITTKDKVTPIRDRISSELELEKTGKGILFILPVARTFGLYENRAKGIRGVTS